MRAWTTILIKVIFVCLVCFPVAVAGKVVDSVALKKMTTDYYQSYESAEKEEDFYKISNQLLDFYKTNGDTRNYFRIRLNEVLFDAEHNRPYRAIRKANKMTDEMKKLGVTYFDMVYVSLGTIFQSRGNYTMAEQYYKEALDAVSPNDKRPLTIIYPRMAFLKCFNEPDEALEWNRKFAEIYEDRTNDRQIYLTILGIVSFTREDKKSFDKAYHEFLKLFHEDNPNLTYGTRTFKALNLAMNSHYQEAIAALEECKPSELNKLEKLDVKKHIYLMAGDMRAALNTTQEKAEIVDSLNSNLIFDNINEINAEANNYLAKRKTSKLLERMAIAIIFLSFAIIALLAITLVRRQKRRKELLERNEQLKTALEMAEESDRMKTEFVRQVSHEIRTPLNAINGFNEVLNQSGITLSDEERQDLVNRINDNSKAITKIIDELLHLSEQESAEYYNKNDDMLCNKVLSELIYSYREKVNSNVELRYTTSLLNRFTIHTNEAAVTEVVDHLLQNAIKFTSHGFIELHSRLSDDEKMVEISVTDTGSGIDTDKRKNIFDQFFKIDHFTQGIGLGLTVSKKIAQKLDGDLLLDESYTEGSRFLLMLPIE